MIATLEFFRVITFVGMYMHHLEYPIPLGALGVSVFFVISGFLYSYNYSNRFQNLNSGVLLNFYRSKFARLYPVHILTFFISIPLLGLTKVPTDILDIFTNLLMMQSWFPRGIHVFSFNSVSWFISNIWFFSLITPFVLYAIHKCELGNSITKLIALNILLFATAVFIALPFKTMESYSFNWWFVYTSPYFRVFDFLIGIITGLLFINIKNSFPSKNVVFYTALEIMAILFFWKFFTMPYFKFPSLVMSIYYEPAIVLVLIVFGLQRGLLSSIINNRFSVLLGRLTYSAYMVHLMIILYVAFLLSDSIFKYKGDLLHLGAQAMVLVFIFCISDVIYRYIEIPGKNLIITVLKTEK